MKTKDFISLILIGFLMITSCDSNGQAKKKPTPEQLKARYQARRDSIQKVDNDRFMKTDVLYKKMAGTWVFKQIPSCGFEGCIFYVDYPTANSICDKLRITFTHEVGTLNGGYYASDKYLLYHLRLAVKDGVILNDKEIGDGSLCEKNSGIFEQVESYDKKTKFIRCIGNTVNALYNDCFRWDAAKEAFYSDYTIKMCGKECRIFGYWEREK